MSTSSCLSQKQKDKLAVMERSSDVTQHSGRTNHTPVLLQCTDRAKQSILPSLSLPHEHTSSSHTSSYQWWKVQRTWVPFLQFSDLSKKCDSWIYPLWSEWLKCFHTTVRRIVRVLRVTQKWPYCPHYRDNPALKNRKEIMIAVH